MVWQVWQAPSAGAPRVLVRDRCTWGMSHPRRREMQVGAPLKAGLTATTTSCRSGRTIQANSAGGNY